MMQAAQTAGLRRDDHMKRLLSMAVGALLLWGVSGAAAQSLGDVARSARKGKAQPSSASHHYDNDNLPKTDHLSVVGQPPAPVPDADAAKAGPAPAPDGTDANKAARAEHPGQTAQEPPKAKPGSVEERKKASADWKKKIDAQKQKVESLSHDLDITQREYRLRAAVMYADAGNRLRNAAMWDKEDTQYKQQIVDKEKAVSAAKQELEVMQEQARKAGVPDRE
jgi:type IV secretory pathway VirB10-like protein